ncbi:hypothetical protein [Nocardia tengchongensis]
MRDQGPAQGGEGAGVGGGAGDIAGQPGGFEVLAEGGEVGEALGGGGEVSLPARIEKAGEPGKLSMKTGLTMTALILFITSNCAWPDWPM